MQIEQTKLSFNQTETDINLAFSPDLILLFVSPKCKNLNQFLVNLKNKYPSSIITGCSTSGEIIDTNVEDLSIVLNAIKFENTQVGLAHGIINDVHCSKQVGTQLMKDLDREDLQHVLVFSEGLKVNGDELVEGLTQNTRKGVGITGGLAGDGTEFQNTFVIYGDKVVADHVIGVGLYGSALKVNYSSNGGWTSFGIERTVTKSKKNVLYEIDGQPALKLYKSFLGEKADSLPSSGLLFPLSMRENESDTPLVRTLLAINEDDQSITFAGNLPEGSVIRLMKGNMDRLISGAELSAEAISNDEDDAELALLISCVGRRVVLKQIVEEELEVVRDVLGEKPVITGFYSYGELAPFGQSEECRLHNQTMTITTFRESLTA